MVIKGKVWSAVVDNKGRFQGILMGEDRDELIQKLESFRGFRLFGKLVGTHEKKLTKMKRVNGKVRRVPVEVA